MFYKIYKIKDLFKKHKKHILLISLTIISFENILLAMKRSISDDKEKTNQSPSKKKSSPTISNEIKETFFDACRDSKSNLVKRLLYLRPELANMKNECNTSGLLLACINNETELAIHISMFCNKETLDSPCINDGPTPLLFACKKENLDLIKGLLAAGANPNKGMIENKEAVTPLSLCLKMNFVAGESLLKSFGAKHKTN